MRSTYRFESSVFHLAHFLFWRRQRHCSARADRIRSFFEALPSVTLGFPRAEDRRQPRTAASPRCCSRAAARGYAGAACELLARHRSTASRRRRAPPRPQTTRRRPQNTAAKSAMKTNAHNFIHACHMNTVCVVIVLAKLIRAPVTADEDPRCVIRFWPFCGLSRLSKRGRAIVGVHMSDGARPPAAPS